MKRHSYNLLNKYKILKDNIIIFKIHVISPNIKSGIKFTKVFSLIQTFQRASYYFDDLPPVSLLPFSLQPTLVCVCVFFIVEKCKYKLKENCEMNTCNFECLSNIFFLRW